MASTKFLVSCIAILALAILSIVNVSASFGEITGLEVNEIDVLETQPIVAFAGETLPVRVIFEAFEDAEDVRVKAWISGQREFATVTERIDVIEGNTYSRLLSIKVPATLDEEDLDEPLQLVVSLENKEGEADQVIVDFTLQRESYVVEILDVDMAGEVTAGDVLALDVVLKNRGRHFSEDTFVVAKIPALQIEDRAYFGDLATMDEPILDDGRQLRNEQDSAERRLFLRIPSDAPAGVYVVEIEEFSDDSSTVVTRKVAIKGAEASAMVIAPVHSKSFNVGEKAQYSVVLVNSGNRLALFELVVEPSSGLNVDVSEPIVVVPAGSSKTVILEATADKAGNYNFAVNVHSGSELIKQESFTANVQGKATAVDTTNPTVLLTVVLAVIFVVLLIVLIVLLTRKPEKSEEVGESYY